MSVMRDRLTRLALNQFFVDGGTQVPLFFIDKNIIMVCNIAFLLYFIDQKPPVCYNGFTKGFLLILQEEEKCLLL